MTTYTPGPWVRHIDGLSVFGAEPDRQQVVDCDVCSPNLPIEERQANARIIAQAPAMLDLLVRFARGDMKLPHSEYDMQLRAEARALIGKIVGAA